MKDLHDIIYRKILNEFLCDTYISDKVWRITWSKVYIKVYEHTNVIINLIWYETDK